MRRISLLDRARKSNAAMLLASALAVMPALGWTGAANAQEQVEIEWATWGWAEPVFQEVAQKYVQMFEAEHPNIKIKQGGVPYPRYEETMLTRLEGGAAPDMTRAADAMYFLFKDRGYLAPLDDYFDIGKVQGRSGRRPGDRGRRWQELRPDRRFLSVRADLQQRAPRRRRYHGAAENPAGVSGRGKEAYEGAGTIRLWDAPHHGRTIGLVVRDVVLDHRFQCRLGEGREADGKHARDDRGRLLLQGNVRRRHLPEGSRCCHLSAHVR